MSEESPVSVCQFARLQVHEGDADAVNVLLALGSVFNQTRFTVIVAAHDTSRQNKQGSLGEALLGPIGFSAFLLFVLSLLKSTLFSRTLLAICESDKVRFFDLFDILGVILMEL